MNRMKPEKKRVFFACVVMAALLVVVGILRMNAVNSAKKQAERTSKTMIAEYAKKQEDLRLTVAVIRGDEMEAAVYIKDGALVSQASSAVSAALTGEVPAGNTDGNDAGDIFTRQYEIGSLTKTFVGALFAKYASEGRLSLTDPVSSYVDFSGRYDPTILELLTHTSAYEDYRTNGFIQMAKYRLNKNPYRGISSERVPVFMRRFSTGMTAPYEYSFSNFGYAVLGNVIEAVEGRPFKEVMEEYIRTELQLPDTAFQTEPSIEKAWKWNEDDAFLPAAGLSSDISDLAAYVRLYFEDRIDEGRLLAITGAKNAGGSSKAALGWGVRPDGVVGHGGETSHYSAQILFDSQKKTAVIVLSNRTESNQITVPELAEQIYLEQFGE